STFRIVEQSGVSSHPSLAEGTKHHRPRLHQGRLDWLGRSGVGLGDGLPASFVFGARMVLTTRSKVQPACAPYFLVCLAQPVRSKDVPGLTTGAIPAKAGEAQAVPLQVNDELLT